MGPVRLSYNLYFSACFLVETVFFPHNKLANNTFNHDFSTKRTGPGREAVGSRSAFFAGSASPWELGTASAVRRAVREQRKDGSQAVSVSSRRAFGKKALEKCKLFAYSWTVRS
jgi:hypothetical protein